MSWWVTPEAYANGHYVTLYAALRHWTATDFPFARIHFSNAEIPGLSTADFRVIESAWAATVRRSPNDE